MVLIMTIMVPIENSSASKQSSRRATRSREWPPTLHVVSESPARRFMGPCKSYAPIICLRFTCLEDLVGL